MPRHLMVELPDGQRAFLTEESADAELQLQEQLKLHPQLLPWDELRVAGPVMVVGRESSLPSGKADLVVLGADGSLVILEFKTGPQNPDFRHCLAQLLDYGSDLWGMSAEEFDSHVVRPYCGAGHCPGEYKGLDLEGLAAAHWPTLESDAVDWRDRLGAQLKDGAFHYVAVAQRFTPAMLQTLRYLNASMRAARFSAVELVRFKSTTGQSAFEARFIAGAEPAGRASNATAKAALAGLDEMLDSVTDDAYRAALTTFFAGLAKLEGLTVYWGSTGCSLRALIPGRSPLSLGWIFPPGPPRWMGLRHVTLGWWEDSNGLALSAGQMAALNAFVATLGTLGGTAPAKPSALTAVTFEPASFVEHHDVILSALASAVVELLAS